MIIDIYKQFDAGLITYTDVEQLLDEAYGPGESDEKTERRERVIQGGQIVKFQLIALNDRARQVIQEAKTAEADPVPEELLRDVPEPVYEHPRPDMALEIKRRVGIIAGVRLWGKPQVRINERGTEGIKVRCPFDNHPDHNPSAWVNTDKNAWYCGKCLIGGDVIDFYAARRYGLAPLDFHKSTEFGNVVKEMGEELGIRVQQDTSGDWFVEDDANPLPSAAPDPAPTEEPVVERPIPDDVEEPETEIEIWVEPEPVVPPSPEADEPITITDDEMLRGVVYDSYDTEEFDIEPVGETPIINWRTLSIPENTFLYDWMEVNEHKWYWIPPEYFLMLGMQAIGLACGHSLTSVSYEEPLSGSTMLCLIGHSGLGKSKAAEKLRGMLNSLTGPKWDPSMGTGVKMLPSPGSPESLLVNAYHEIDDPLNATVKVEVGITAWLFEDEFVSFTDKANRRASSYIKQRMMRFHDFVKTKDEPELVAADHSLTNKHREVHDTFFSGCFLTQPEALPGLVNHIDLISGFLARLLPVFGTGREPKQASRKVVNDPDPPYNEMYRQMWIRARTKRQVLPFDDATNQLIDTHPFFGWVVQAQAIASIYGRLTHNVLRFAFLLAVNDNSRSVTPAHLHQAIKLGEYFKEGIGKLVGDVQLVREDDCAAKIVKFVKNRYLKHKEWPTTKIWQGDRTSYRDFSSDERERALESLYREQRLVEVYLLKDKTKSTVFIVPEDKWVGYAHSHRKTYKWEEVYP